MQHSLSWIHFIPGVTSHPGVLVCTLTSTFTVDDVPVETESHLDTFHDPLQLAGLTLCRLDLPVEEVQLPDSQCSAAQKMLKT